MAKGSVIALAFAGAWKVWHSGEKSKHAAFYEAYNKSLAGKDLQGNRPSATVQHSPRYHFVPHFPVSFIFSRLPQPSSFPRTTSALMALLQLLSTRMKWSHVCLGSNSLTPPFPTA